MGKKHEKIMNRLERITLDKPTLIQAERNARNDWWYGSNEQILDWLYRECPGNDDDSDYGISKKVKYLDEFYATHLRMMGKNYIERTVDTILSIDDFDERVKKGDNELVRDLMNITPGRQFLSFASKYCALHNPEFYFIVDSVNREVLPKLFKVVARREEDNGNTSRSAMLYEHSRNIRKWLNKKDYTSYNDSVTNLLGNLMHEVDNAKRKLDWLLWYEFKDML